MKTYLKLKGEDIVAFRIYGGGGNRRKLKSLGVHPISFFTSDLYLPVDRNGNTIEGEYLDSAGNPVGLTTQQEKTGLGTIDFDGDYDTVYTTRVRDIDHVYGEEEIAALFRDEAAENTAEGILLYLLDCGYKLYEIYGMSHLSRPEFEAVCYNAGLSNEEIEDL